MNDRLQKSRTRKAALSLAAILAGGSTFTSCDTKVKQAFTGALEQTVLSLLDPANYLDAAGEESSVNSTLSDR